MRKLDVGRALKVDGERHSRDMVRSAYILELRCDRIVQRFEVSVVKLSSIHCNVIVSC